MGITGTRGLHWVSLEISAKDKGFSFFFFLFSFFFLSKDKVLSQNTLSRSSLTPQSHETYRQRWFKIKPMGSPSSLAHPEMTSLKNKQHGERGLFLLMFLPQIPERHSLVSIASEPQHALCVSDSVVSDSL